MKIKLFSLFFFTASICFSQQIPKEIQPPSWQLTNIKSVKAYTLPAFDLKALEKEDEINDKDKSKPWRFGHKIYVNHNAKEFGEWTTLKNGDKVWRMSYKSKGAHTLNFIFDEFNIPKGAKLYVYNNAKNDLLRPFTHNNNNPEDVLGTWLVNGDQAWIEYYQPVNVIGIPKLRVGSVIHGYRTADTYNKALNDSGDCNQDVDCDISPNPDPYQINEVKDEVKKAVGMLVTGGNGFCSGTLINNTNNDGTPYFMTANHCGGGESTWAFRFNWRSPNPSCSTTAPSTDGSFNQTVSGAVVRASSSQSDMELVEITDTSFFNNNPDVVWVGWNRSSTYVPKVNFGIHHPSGDIQKVCREDDGAYRRTQSFNGNPNTQVWYIDEWELGVTEPGSSGSGLFNESGHLIGVLAGGAAACSGTVNNGLYDYYGRFDVAWDFGSTTSSRLREWLDPNDTGVEILDMYPAPQVFDVDASVEVSVIDADVCDGNLTMTITLVNKGNLPLTSADITYSINPLSPTTVNWTGNLVSGESIEVSSSVYENLTPGDYQFEAVVTNPNGIMDQNVINNKSISEFIVPPFFNTNQIVLNLTTDNYGEETSWEVRDENGTLIESGPDSAYADNTTIQEVITLPTDELCYTFTIFDEYADGICCGHGSGSYSLEDENSNVMMSSGGEFGSSESFTFNTSQLLSTSEEFNLDNSISIYPNPAVNTINVNYTENTNLQYKINNILGQEVLKGVLNESNKQINISTFQSGVYFLTINNPKATLVKKIMKK